MGMSPLVQQLSEKLDQWEPEAPRRRWVPKAEVMRLLATGKPDRRFFEDIAELGTQDDLENPWTR